MTNTSCLNVPLMFYNYTTSAVPGQLTIKWCFVEVIPKHQRSGGPHSAVSFVVKSNGIFIVDFSKMLPNMFKNVI